MNKLVPFFFGRLFGSLGNEFLLFAVPLLIYTATQSVAWSAAAFAIEWVVRLISLPLAGTLADRFDSRVVYIVADIARLLSCLVGFLALLAAPLPGYLVVIILSAIVGFCFELIFISVETVAQKLSPPDLLTRTQSTLQSIDQLSMLAGPALAGLFVLFADLRYLLPLTAAMFLASALAIIRTFSTSMEPPPPASDRPILRDIREGLLALLQIPRLVLMVSLTMLLNLMQGVLLILGPALTTSIFAKPISYFAVLSTFSSITGIAATVATPFLARVLGLNRVGISAFFIAAAGGLTAALADSFWVYALANALVMSMDGVFNVYIRSERARLIPAPLFGRTVGVVVLLNFLPLPFAGAAVAAVTPHLDPRQFFFGLVLGCTILSIPLLLLLLRERLSSLPRSANTTPSG